MDFGYKSAWDLERLEPNTFFPVPSCVAFARRTGEVGGRGRAVGRRGTLAGRGGIARCPPDAGGITDTSEIGESPYAGYSRQGASIVPRCLFFVNEIESRTIIQASGAITVNPRRGSQDKAPWKTLDLSAISEQTIESATSMTSTWERRSFHTRRCRRSRPSCPSDAVRTRYRPIRGRGR